VWDREIVCLIMYVGVIEGLRVGCQSSASGVWTDRLCVIPDPDMHASNPAEVKYYKACVA
jgi:hypothetical protein